MLEVMKPEILAILMGVAIGCQVNNWIKKAFSSKNFANPRMKDWAIFPQLALGEMKSMHCCQRKENIQLVKEKLPGFLAAVETFKEAHLAYLLNLHDEISIARCQEQLNLES